LISPLDWTLSPDQLWGNLWRATTPTDHRGEQETEMTTTTPTLTSRVSETAARLHPEPLRATGLRARLAAAVVRFSERGQLGSDAERDLGRRTGARA
jgi:hypothetical protein